MSHLINLEFCIFTFHWSIFCFLNLFAISSGTVMDRDNPYCLADGWAWANRNISYTHGTSWSRWAKGYPSGCATCAYLCLCYNEGFASCHVVEMACNESLNIYQWIFMSLHMLARRWIWFEMLWNSECGLLFSRIIIRHVSKESMVKEFWFFMRAWLKCHVPFQTVWPWARWWLPAPMFLANSK